MFRLAAVLLGPALLLLVEGALRLAGYGIGTRPFVRPRLMREAYVDNAFFRYKYLPFRPAGKDPREFEARNLFPVDKPAGGTRGFLIGGSTAEGFPFEANHSFGKIAELALNAAAGTNRVRIVNLGFSAMSSYYVADAVRKALAYDPDFIVIYAGHNEYYGTIGQRSGGRHWTRRLYVRAKDFRLAQLVCNLAGEGGPPPAGNLMTDQYHDATFPPDPARDNEVADCFVRNIRSAVARASARGIPVVLMEPVCNLTGMPPFAGDGDEACRAFVTAYREALARNGPAAVEAFFRSHPRPPAARHNAAVRYLDAVAASRVKGFAPAPFAEARDMDLAPFRVRSALLHRLEEYATAEAQRNPRFRYVRTSEFLKEKIGAAAFGNHVFIDHLHFNQRGQILVAELLARELAAILKLEPEPLGRAVAFLADTGRVEDAVHYLPIHEILAFGRIQELLPRPPFSKMLIPYQLDQAGDYLADNEVFQDPSAFRLLDGARLKEAQQKLCDHYLNTGRPKKAIALARASVFVSPGAYFPYLNLAKLLSSQRDHDAAAVAELFETSYRLSGGMKEAGPSKRSPVPVQGSDAMKQR